MELCDRDIEIVAIRWPIGPYFARLHDVYNDFEDNKSLARNDSVNGPS